MLTRALVFGLGLSLAGASFAGNADALKALQGLWKVESFRYDGKNLPKEAVDQMRIEIAGKSMRVHFGDKVIAEATVQKLNTAKNPKEMDLEALTGPSKGKTDLQCYSLDNDTLKFWAYSGPKAQRDRFTKVPDGTEMDVDLVVLKRSK